MRVLIRIMVQKNNCLDLKNSIFLAPMDGITDVCFREIAIEEGADYVISELTSVDQIILGKVESSRIEKGLLNRNIVQLFGSDPEKFALAARILDEFDVDEINLNFGCPSYSIVKSGSGAYILKRLDLMKRIIIAVIENFSRDVSVKVRIGFDVVNIKEVINLTNSLDLSYVVIHGRTAVQGYSGSSNWSLIREASLISNKPVIGNGDINEKTDLRELFEFVDGVMIGRSAIGTPQIFNVLKNGSRLIVTSESQINLFLRYYEKFKKRFFRKGFLRLKQQALFFFNRFPGSKSIRKRISEIQSEEELINFIYSLKR